MVIIKDYRWGGYEIRCDGVKCEKIYTSPEETWGAMIKDIKAVGWTNVREDKQDIPEKDRKWLNFCPKCKRIM